MTTKSHETPALKQKAGNYIALLGLPILFVLMPWVLAVALPHHVVPAVLVVTPLALVVLSVYEAITYRPSITFGLVAGASMWWASRLFYPDGAGWYVPIVLLIVIGASLPWGKKFVTEWSKSAEDES
ncbi:hypothetical protein [Rothia endophytica]|uniref:hypothetical protein n=1 Tax=Rothia endophytica TaxID=1324766 RepID=UPI001F33BEE3|nr:hypothetical protein [Rothia endophytica]